MRHTRLYQWNGDRMIAAYSLSGAKKLVREFEGTTKGHEIISVSGPVDYCDFEGEPAGTINGEDCSAAWPTPQIIYDLG